MRSPSRRSWSTADSNNFKSHHWADFIELQALVRCFGPYGVKVLEKPLLEILRRNVRELHQLLKNNAGVLNDFSARYLDPGVESGVVKKAKDLDKVVEVGMRIGNALLMRRFLRDATGAGVFLPRESSMAALYRCLNSSNDSTPSSFESYRTNISAAKSFAFDVSFLTSPRSSSRHRSSSMSIAPLLSASYLLNTVRTAVSRSSASRIASK